MVLLFLKKFYEIYLDLITNTICNIIWFYEIYRICSYIFSCIDATLETVQDYLIKLDIKPLMHLLKISIFSINNDILRLTKIMNNLVKDLKTLSFKVIFQCLKLVESFPKKIFCQEYLIARLTYINEIFENFDI